MAHRVIESKPIVFTMSELKAHRLLTQRHFLTTDISAQDIREAADEIILLAEKIKAERLSAAMNP